MGDNMLLGYDLDDPEQEKALLERIMEGARAGKTVRETLEIQPEELEQLYSYAYGKYQYGDYKAAVALFRYLFMLDQKNYKYTLGYAAAMHKAGDYETAAHTYVLAALYKPDDPVAYFHGADCFLRLDETGMAIEGLYSAIQHSEGKPEFDELKERAKLILATLEEKKPKSKD